MKNLDVVIAFPLLKNVVAKSKRDREGKTSPCTFGVLLLYG
jgi:hypothetical protein